MALDLRSYRARARQGGHATLAMAGVTVRLYADRPEVAHGALRYFAPIVAADASEGAVIYAVHDVPHVEMDRLVDIAPKPGRTAKEAVYEDAEGRVVFKRRSSVAIVVRPPEYFIVGDLGRQRQQVYNLVGHVLARGFLDQGFVMLHASAVWKPGRGVAFGATSGGGKSSMALAMVERGFQFVSNDRLFVRPTAAGVEMLGMPKWPRVNPGTLLRLASLQPLLTPEERATVTALPPGELWALEQKHDVDVEATYGAGTIVTRTAPLDELYLLRWAVGVEGDVGVRELPPDARSPALLPLRKGLGPYDSPELERGAEETLAMVATRLPTYVVHGRADVFGLRDLLDTAAAPR